MSAGRPLKIGIWQMKGKARSQQIAAALATGAREVGMFPVLRFDAQYTKPREDVAAFYGFQNNMPRIMEDYVESGRTVVFVDLGYWLRRHGGRWAGYHKVAINSRHPDGYMMDIPRDPSRIGRFGVKPMPWRKKGEHIVVAGMSGKSAESYGLKPQQWETWAINELRKHTRRPIIYRPKPNWPGARDIPGSNRDADDPLDRALNLAHAVVTHHSNVAVDAITAGVPAFCWHGAARLMSLQDLARIETPWKPDGREAWLRALSWCQWSVAEMRDGVMWRSLRRDGVIP